MFTTQTAAQSLALRQLLRKGISLAKELPSAHIDANGFGTFEKIAVRLEASKSATASVGAHRLTMLHPSFQKRRIVRTVLDKAYPGTLEDVLQQTITVLRNRDLMNDVSNRDLASSFMTNLVSALETEKNTQPSPRMTNLNAEKRHAGVCRF